MPCDCLTKNSSRRFLLVCIFFGIFVWSPSSTFLLSVYLRQMTSFQGICTSARLNCSIQITREEKESNGRVFFRETRTDNRDLFSLLCSDHWVATRKKFDIIIIFICYWDSCSSNPASQTCIISVCILGSRVSFFMTLFLSFYLCFPLFMNYFMIMTTIILMIIVSFFFFFPCLWLNRPYPWIFLWKIVL